MDAKSSIAAEHEQDGVHLVLPIEAPSWKFFVVKTCFLRNFFCASYVLLTRDIFVQMWIPRQVIFTSAIHVLEYTSYDVNNT